MSGAVLCGSGAGAERVLAGGAAEGGAAKDAWSNKPNASSLVGEPCREKRRNTIKPTMMSAKSPMRA